MNEIDMMASVMFAVASVIVAQVTEWPWETPSEVGTSLSAGRRAPL